VYQLFWKTALNVKGKIIVPNHQNREDKKVTTILKVSKAGTVIMF